MKGFFSIQVICFQFSCGSAYRVLFNFFDCYFMSNWSFLIEVLSFYGTPLFLMFHLIPSFFYKLIVLHIINKVIKKYHIQVLYQKVKNLANQLIFYKLHPIIYTKGDFLSAPKENKECFNWGKLGSTPSKTLLFLTPEKPH